MQRETVSDRRIQQLVAEGEAKAAERAGDLDQQGGGALPPKPPSRSPDVIARLLGERGFWSLAPADQLELFTVEDIRGTLEVIPSSRGAAGMREALVFSSLASLWAHGPRDDNELITSARAIAEQAGISWSGQAGRGILDALEILRLTGYRMVLDAGERGGKDRTFTLLASLETEWGGAVAGPRRNIRIEWDPLVFRWLSDRAHIRTIDTAVMRALGPQREMARRLFLLLECAPAGRLDSQHEVINRLIDDRLAGTLGTSQPLKKLAPALRRASEAINEASPRYQVEVLPREKKDIPPGAPRYLLRATRRRAKALRA